MRRAALAFTLLSLLHGLDLAAQRLPSLEVGRRVHVTTDSGAWIGTLVEQEATDLQVRWAGERGSLVVTVPAHQGPVCCT